MPPRCPTCTALEDRYRKFPAESVERERWHKAYLDHVYFCEIEKSRLEHDATWVFPAPELSAQEEDQFFAEWMKERKGA